MLPPSPSHLIQTRETELGWIKEKFSALRQRHLHDGVIGLAITGSPGYGKSQLARQYGETYGEEALEAQGSAVVLTLIAENLDTFDKSMTTIALELGCDAVVKRLEHVENPRKRLEILLPAVRGKLRAARHWFLIVDNLCNEVRDKWWAYWPQPGTPNWGTGAVLVTSQERGILGSSDHVAEMSLTKGMTPNDSIRLLTNLSGIGDRDGALDVAKRLEFLPLPLSSAGVYVRVTNEMDAGNAFTWSNYVDELDAGLRDLCDDTSVEHNRTYPRTMRVAVTMAANRMAMSKAILRSAFIFFGSCANQALPLDSIIKYCQRDDATSGAAAAKPIVKKCSLLIVTRAYVKRVEMVEVHQVTHSVFAASVMSWLMPERPMAHAHVQLVMSVLNESYSVGDDSDDVHERYMLRRAYLAHLEKVLSTPEKVAMDNVVVVDALQNRADIYDLLGEHRIRCEILEDAFAKVNDVSGGGEDRLDAVLLSLGCALADIGEKERAVSLLTQCLEICRDRSKSKRRIARVLCSLARVYEDMSKYEKAVELLEEALRLQTETFPREGNMAMGATLTDLSRAYHDIGDMNRAKAYIDRALEMKKNVVGEMHPTYATSLIHLGRYHLDPTIDDPSKAIDALEKALHIRVEHLGDSHDLVLKAKTTLGRAYYKNDDLEKSCDVLSSALKSYESETRQHADKNDYAILLVNLGNTLLAIGGEANERTALEKAVEAVENRKEALGENHYEMAFAFECLGLARHRNGDSRSGLELLRRAREIQVSHYGENHSRIRRTEQLIDEASKSLEREREQSESKRRRRNEDD